mmetsp:Transcript_265/g.659  ORF Transcript_265/g.659 Transcript_265/m.659 type:complete len:460 (+) Transcript_265:812-2191(+)
MCWPQLTRRSAVNLATCATQVKQQPDYKCRKSVAIARAKLSSLPPLVTAHEVMDLRAELEEVARGERFILQGGDCAERFDDCTSGHLETKLQLMFQMGVVIVWGARIPVTRVGRIAGQYHKPRSKPTEKHGDTEILCYKGDAINGHDIHDREHDPDRLVQGYFHSAATLNYIRCLLDAGFADVARYHPREWDISFVKDTVAKRKYNNIAKDISHAFEFMASCSKTPARSEGSSKIFTSHEGLVLDFEEAMTREVEGKFYNLGAHMIWIGDRTRQLDGAHIEYFRGVSNPIGCKCGPTTDPVELVKLVSTLNPDNVAGKIVLISRFGAGKVDDKLREIIHAVQAAKLNVVWQCDPMHGNTYTTAEGVKTRAFDDVLAELLATFKAHDECGTWLGGVHLEMTGEKHVTECVGGSCGLKDTDLHESYESQCDPRLNGEQSLEMAFQLVEVLKHRKLHRTGTR